MEERKYMKVSAIAKMFSLSPSKVREHCHVRGQRFAIQTTKNGCFLIDPQKYEKFLSSWRTMMWKD